MIRVSRSSLCFALLAGSLSCATPNAPVVDAIVRVQSDTLVVTQVATGSATWLQFTIPLSIQNLGPTSVTPTACASSIEVQMDDRWERAWSPICALNASPDSYPARTVRTFTLSVSAALPGGRGSPVWGGRRGASYRVSLGLAPSGRTGRIPLVTSNAFFLRNEP